MADDGNSAGEMISFCVRKLCLIYCGPNLTRCKVMSAKAITRDLLEVIGLLGEGFDNEKEQPVSVLRAHNAF